LDRFVLRWTGRGAKGSLSYGAYRVSCNTRSRGSDVAKCEENGADLQKAMSDWQRFPHSVRRDPGRRSPILNHQIELVDEAVDFLEIFTTAFLRFDIERATKSDHVAQVTDGVL
jgi:hypothetical protein